MKETIKNTRGITLIALVITIIVLLILAIVTIRIITSGGIIEHAKNGAQAYNDAQTNELALLKDAESKMAEINTKKINWWDFTSAEKAKFDKIKTDAEGQGTIYLIATKKTGDMVYRYELNNSSCILISTDEVCYAFPLKANTRVLETTVKDPYQWYSSTDGSSFANPTKYEGQPPIARSDYPAEITDERLEEIQSAYNPEAEMAAEMISGGIVISDSYLEKIINSFN